MLSELAAFVRMAGTLEIASGGALSVRVDTESEAVAQRMDRLIRELYGVNGQIAAQERRRLGKRHRYMLRVQDAPAARRILSDTGVLAGEASGEGIAGGVPAELVHRDCCRRAFLRGAFLGAGSVANPERGYHAEFVTADGDTARSLTLLLRAFELNAKMVARKGAFVVYLKESEHIVNLLSLMGASAALLEMENVRVYREIRNGVNRTVNCETANLSKTGRAAGRQADAIRAIEAAGIFPRLGQELRAVAELRLEHPEATLRELADMIPSLGRSGVNHRLRKLCAMAKELQQTGGSFHDQKKSDHPKQ
jgi:DNA-binding protein WhiA